MRRSHDRTSSGRGYRRLSSCAWAARPTHCAISRPRSGPFDLVFIDADKPGNADYFAWALKMSRRGSVIIVDNVVRNGAVIDPSSTDASVRGVRRLNELLANEPRVSTTAIQTVGSKGYDGFAIALVVADG